MKAVLVGRKSVKLGASVSPPTGIFWTSYVCLTYRLSMRCVCVYQRCCYTRTVCWCILWIDLVKWHARPEWIAKFLNVQLSQLLSQTVRPVKQFIRCWPCVSGKSKVSLTMPTTFDEYSNNVQTWQWPVCRSVRAVSQWLVNEEREISEKLGLTHVAYSHYTDEWLTSSVNASVPVVWSEWPIRTGVWN